MTNEQAKEIKNLVKQKEEDLQGWKFLRRIPWVRPELQEPPDEHDYELLLQHLARILQRKA